MMPNESLDLEDQFPANCVSCDRDLNKGEFFPLPFVYVNSKGDVIDAKVRCLCPNCQKTTDLEAKLVSYRAWYGMLPDEWRLPWIWLGVELAILMDH